MMTTAYRLIKEQGRTITWLANKVGYERTYMSRMVRGQVPMPPTVARSVAELLGAPVEFILPPSNEKGGEMQCTP